jgi:hypothetical protein
MAHITEIGGKSPERRRRRQQDAGRRNHMPRAVATRDGHTAPSHREYRAAPARTALASCRSAPPGCKLPHTITSLPGTGATFGAARNSAASEISRPRSSCGESAPTRPFPRTRPMIRSATGRSSRVSRIARATSRTPAQPASLRRFNMSSISRAAVSPQPRCYTNRPQIFELAGIFGGDLDLYGLARRVCWKAGPGARHRHR